MVSGHALIRFENVGLRYGVGHEILRDINFHLLPGSFHFLTGPSGAGKTTLLRLLNMSLRPTRGLVYLFGRNIAKNTTGQRADLRRRIGIVFQDFRLLDHLTTWENVALPLRVMGRNQSDYQEDVTELLKWVGLGDRMNAFPAVLSGGKSNALLLPGLSSPSRSFSSPTSRPVTSTPRWGAVCFGFSSN